VDINIGKLKSYKSPGTDQIPAEPIKAGGETLYSETHRLICSIWNKEELPQQWKESITVPIWDHQCSRDVGLEINAEKTKYMIMSHYQNSGQNQNIRIAIESFENVTKFKYLGTKLTNQNDIHDEIKSRLNSGNACYHSVQNILSSRLISKKLKIKIYKTVIFPVVLYGCEIWSFTLREEHRLRVFENRVLRKIFGPKREEDGSWRKFHNDELHSLYFSPNNFRMIKSRRMRWAGHVTRMGEGRGVYRVLVGRREGTRPLGRPRLRWEDNIKMDLREIGIDGANRIRLAQDRVQWRAFMSTGVNVRIS
jgi:hypothetical protein